MISSSSSTVPFIPFNSPFANLLPSPPQIQETGRSRERTMGNCQAAEAVAVVIQHPSGGRVERAHGAVSAAAIMAANPGHYVAAVVAAAPPSPPPAKRRLKLLRPDDTLVLGGVYRLVTFEEVLREFVSKRHAMLSRVVIAAADDEEDAATAADGKGAHRWRGGGHGYDVPSAPESDSTLAKEELQRSGGEESTMVRRPVGIGRRAILHRRHMMECLDSKQGGLQGLANRLGSLHCLKEHTPGPSDPSSVDDSPPEPEPGFDAVAMAQGMVLGGRFGLSRHRQWRPALPSIAEGSVVC